MDAGIKKLEIVSNALLLLYVFIFFYFSPFVSEQRFYCFGVKINWAIVFFPLIAAVIFEIIILLICKKRNLPIKKSIESFLKLFIISFIAPFVIAVLFMISPSTKMRAIDARKISDLRMIYEAQEKFFRENQRYTTSLEELDQLGYFSGIIKEVEIYNIIFEGSTDGKTWKAQVNIKQYEREICSWEKTKKIYVCNEMGCKEEVVPKE